MVDQVAWNVAVPRNQTIPLFALSDRSRDFEGELRDCERLRDCLLKTLDADELERALVRILAVAPGV